MKTTTASLTKNDTASATTMYANMRQAQRLGTCFCGSVRQVETHDGVEWAVCQNIACRDAVKNR